MLAIASHNLSRIRIVEEAEVALMVAAQIVLVTVVSNAVLSGFFRLTPIDRTLVVRLLGTSRPQDSSVIYGSNNTGGRNSSERK